jgi:hypothetical protein
MAVFVVWQDLGMLFIILKAMVGFFFLHFFRTPAPPMIRDSVKLPTPWHYDFEMKHLANLPLCNVLSSSD